jgi:hypothetical protein
MCLILNLTPFELCFGCKLSVSHLRPFGCKCFVLKCGNLDKFESCSSDDILLGYTLMANLIECLTLRLTPLFCHVMCPSTKLLIVLMISLSVKVTRKWRRSSL